MLTNRLSRLLAIGAPNKLLPYDLGIGQARSLSDGSLEKKQVSEQGQRDDDLFKYLWLKCSGHEAAVLDSYETFLKQAAENLDIEYVRTETPFRNIYRRTMLASRFVHKKYRTQYEMRDYYRHLLFKNLTGSTLDTYLEYVERNLPEGVILIAEKHRLAKLPFELVEQNKNT